jgi:cytochrome c oxidase assembly protein subunit 15
LVNFRLLSRAAFCASFFALGVIALGAFTRLMDAGLGCPDWPGCYGHLTAPLTDGLGITAYKAWTEMIHRYFVGALSILIISIVIMIFSKETFRTRANCIMAIFLLVLLSYQIMLGQWTVTLKLLPVIVSQHLLGGYLILSTLWLVYLNNNSIFLAKNTGSASKILPWAMLGFVLLFIQIMLGAWTSTNYASLSCADFPFCLNDQPFVWHLKEAFNLFSPIGVNYEGGVLPAVIRQTIQMAHRFGALILTSYFLTFFAYTSLQLKNRPDLLKSLYIVLGLLCVQLCIGISNVIFKLPLVSAMSHTIVAALLLISLITFIFKLICNQRGPVA